MRKAKKLLCALLIVLTAVTMLSGPFQVPVQAARTVTANKNPNKAVNIKKKGTYRVLSKTKMNKDDYIRFTAPKKGKYTLTFSDFRKVTLRLKDILDLFTFIRIPNMEEACRESRLTVENPLF